MSSGTNGLSSLFHSCLYIKHIPSKNKKKTQNNNILMLDSQIISLKIGLEEVIMVTQHHMTIICRGANFHEL